MKKNIALFGVGVLIIIMLSSFIKDEIKSNQQFSEATLGEELLLNQNTRLQKNVVAPDFTYQNLAGKSYTLSELKGKNVVVNFWASWCGPCKVEMPHFQSYYKQYAKQDNTELLAVNMTFANDSRKKVEQFIESFDLTFPIVLEEVEGASKQYEVLTIPSTIFINEKGEVERYFKGPLNTNTLREFVLEMNQ